MNRKSAPLWVLVVGAGALCLSAQQASNDGLKLPPRDQSAMQTQRPNLTN